MVCPVQLHMMLVFSSRGGFGTNESSNITEKTPKNIGADGECVEEAHFLRFKVDLYQCHDHEGPDIIVFAF